ncbi:pre-mRNA-splicing factor SYF2-like isoform X2 [Xenia sp. Carnegie-2017]|uniref:pre-mRNA-splicing factor SYF2-like isoform X2 n=1 Tax=Xenia sp. Carnegie-2017 TaxID=2897299 RepID=UPI001F0417D4|nr:pre-mRNA-splicing factor SYF2-like isoform X2 [Xenia sp. Carnegie-2017]
MANEKCSDNHLSEVVNEGASGSNSKSSKELFQAFTKKNERMRKLKELHLRRNEARKMNYQEVVEEDRRNKLPANWEAKQKRVEWELEDHKARTEAEANGEDYDRLKLLEVTADDADKQDKRKKRKKNTDVGFSDFAAAQERQYSRLVKQMKPDLTAYQEQKEKLGERMYPSANNIAYGGDGKVSKEGVDRMVADLEKQIEKRSKYSRRRAHCDEADISFINERNMKFNKKLSRFYDQYTGEIRQNLERGTAI